jgi:hypothetical protein
MEQLGYYWTNFHEILYLSVFSSYENQCIFLIISHSYLVIKRNVSNLWRKSKHILCSINLFFENCALYEIMWKNVVRPGRSQMRVWCMCIACWITKATSTHLEYIILIALPLQQWLHERTSVLHYTYTACLFLFKWRAV